jgi:uncharacterized protein HemX
MAVQGRLQRVVRAEGGGSVDALALIVAVVALAFAIFSFVRQFRLQR